MTNNKLMLLSVMGCSQIKFRVNNSNRRRGYMQCELWRKVNFCCSNRPMNIGGLFFYLSFVLVYFFLYFLLALFMNVT